jgi:hypothetical protein
LIGTTQDPCYFSLYSTLRLRLRNTDLMEPELQRDVAPAPMAPPPNLIIKNIVNLRLWQEQEPYQNFYLEPELL